MASELLFCDLGPTDAETLAQLYGQAFQSAWGVDFFRDFVTRPTSVAIGVKDASNGIIGFCLGTVVLDEAEVITVVVAVERQGEGVGTSLIAKLIEKMRLRDVQSIFLEVHEKNEHAKNLYEKLGFAEIARRPNYYKASEGKTGNALVLRRKISEKTT